MADVKKRKGGGAKLTRTETVTVRLDEKLRYLAELAARKQRRTLSSYVEWAIQDSLERAVLKPASGDEPAKTVASESARLWDVDQAGRFVKLGSWYPDLLTHDEQLRQHLLVRELIWDVARHLDSSGPKSETDNDPASDKAIRDRLAMVRAIWNRIRAMSEADLAKGYLPPDFPPASVIAEAAKKEIMEKTAAAQKLHLQHSDADPHDVEDV
jgi:hypothetical protein